MANSETAPLITICDTLFNMKLFFIKCFVSVCRREADICFLVDSSSSINQQDSRNWGRIKQFVSNVVDRLDIGPQNTKVAVIKFFTTAQIIFHLNRYDTKQDVKDAIDDMTYGNGRTNTQQALRLMRTQVFTPANGDRPDIVNVGIVITDGVSNVFKQNTIPEANRAKNEGVQMFAIGITNQINRTELQGVASRNDWVFEVTDFVALADILNSIVRATCITRPTTTPVSTTPSLPPPEGKHFNKKLSMK